VARSRFRPDRGLSVRMGLTMVLLALLYVVLILAIGYFTDAIWLGILIGLGVDLYTVSKILGHGSISTTQRYAHLQVDQQRQALEKLGNLVQPRRRKAA